MRVFFNRLNFHFHLTVHNNDTTDGVLFAFLGVSIYLSVFLFILSSIHMVVNLHLLQ